MLHLLLALLHLHPLLLMHLRLLLVHLLHLRRHLHLDLLTWHDARRAGEGEDLPVGVDLEGLTGRDACRHVDHHLRPAGAGRDAHHLLMLLHLLHLLLHRLSKARPDTRG